MEGIQESAGDKSDIISKSVAPDLAILNRPGGADPADEERKRRSWRKNAETKRGFSTRREVAFKARLEVVEVVKAAEKKRRNKTEEGRAQQV